jgi:heat shock protein HslJ
MSRFALVATLALTACITPVHSEEPVPSGPWYLATLNGKSFSASAILSFDADGHAVGQAPCNRFSATNGATYPALALTEITATEMACDALAEESRFFQALAAMTAARLQDADRLLLTGPDGQTMVFEPLVIHDN